MPRPGPPDATGTCAGGAAAGAANVGGCGCGGHCMTAHRRRALHTPPLDAARLDTLVAALRGVLRPRSRS